MADRAAGDAALYRARLPLGEENGYCESCNGKMRDQLLNGELFDTLKEAQIIIERWRIHSHTVRPHSSLGGQPPAPETLQFAS
jgi:putative transposase